MSLCPPLARGIGGIWKLFSGILGGTVDASVQTMFLDSLMAILEVGIGWNVSISEAFYYSS